MARGGEGMSTNIDQRIVEMQFDNGQFERGAKQSIETLDKLDKSLDLRESAKNLTALSDAGKNFSLDGVASGIEVVQQKFTALEIMGITALQRITNQAITTGENLVKSLSLDQIAQGFGKYEQKTTSVQTIVNATGESIDSVSEKLAKLNWFTDETSYNFTDMVGNIGKFTSMGIDLNTSVTAMEGIANWAAISGQGVNEASRAMYNLSQAIGVGAVKLMDWKSVENANMATKEFKETAIETAKALGELNAQGKTAKGTAVTVENFSSTLSEAWFTSDVLLKTLNKYGEYADQVYTVATEKGLTCAQAMEQVNGETMNLGERAFKAAQEAKTFTEAIDSVKDAVSTGWANTFEIIFGNYEEAKNMWTDLANDLYDIFAGGAEDRNNFLEEVFAANTASIDGFDRPSGRELMIQSAANALQMVKQQMDIVKGSWDDVFPPATANQVYKFLQRIEKLSEKLVLSDDNADKLKRTLKGLFSVFGIVKDAVTKLTKSGLKVLNALIGDANLNILDYTSNIGDHIVGLREWLKTNAKLNAVIGKGTDFLVNGIIKNGLSGILNALNKLGDSAGNFGAIFSGVGSAIGTVIDNVWKGLKTVFSWFTENISLKGVLGVITAILGVLTGKELYGAASGIQEFVSKIFSKTGLEEEKANIIDKITNLFDSLHNTLQSFTSGIKVTSLFAIAAAIGILAAAMNSMSNLRFPDILKSLTAIGLMLGMLTITLDSMSKSLNKTGSKGLIKAGVSLVLVAEAINILAKAMGNIGELSINDIGKGLIGIGGGLIELCAALKVLNGTKISFRTSLSMLALAESCNILANALDKFSNMQWDEIKRGLVGMGGALLEVGGISGALGYLTNFAGLLGSGSLLLAIQGLNDLADAFYKFGTMSWDEISRGLDSMGGALSEVSLGALANTFSIFGASAIQKMAVPLGELADSVKKWEDVTLPDGMNLKLGSLANGVNSFMFSGMGGEAIGVVAPGIGELADSVKKWKDVSVPQEIGTKLGSLANGVNSFMFSGLGASAISIMASSVGVLADSIKKWEDVTVPDNMGTKLTSFASGVNSFTFSGLGASAIDTVAESIGVLADSVQKWSGVNVPSDIGEQLGNLSNGINSFSFSFLGAWSIETLNESFGGLAECVKQWNGVSIPEGLGADLTDLANGVKSFDDTDSFATNLKTFGENFKKYYDSISAIEPEKLTNATNGLKSIIGVVDLLDGKDPGKLWTMGQAMQDLFSVDDSMYNNLELLYSNMQKTGETMIDRLMLGITNKAPNVALIAQQTITNIIGDMATQIGTDQTVVIQAFERMLNAAIEYLNSRKEDFGKYINSVCDDMIAAMSDRYDDFANAGSYVIAGFVKGMKDAKMDAITAASNIALEAYRAACDTLDVHSPSKKFAWIGMQTDKGLAEGMLKYGRVAKEAAKRTASETVNAAQNSIYGIRGMFDGIDLTPIIRPIVDLDAVKNGVAQLNGMTTGMNTGLRLDTAYAYVSSAAASMDAKKANENQNGLEKVVNELKALRDNPPVTMNNKFDITNPDPEAVANKAVSKIVRQIGRDTSRG